MRIIEWDDFITQKKMNPDANISAVSATIGVFDGVHKGHQALINRIIAQSRIQEPSGNGAGTSLSTVITFKQNPKKILSPERFQGDIFSLKQKLGIFESFLVDQAILIDFSGNFSKMSGREFIEILKNYCGLRYLAVGTNFRCGYHLDTDAKMIAALMGSNTRTELVEQVFAGASPVSSSRVRQALTKGNLAEAAELLGRNVVLDLSGIPFASDTAGTYRSWDTAGALRITPPDGMYQVEVWVSCGDANNRDKSRKEIFIKDGKIFIPVETGNLDLHVEYIEFI